MIASGDEVSMLSTLSSPQCWLANPCHGEISNVMSIYPVMNSC